MQLGRIVSSVYSFVATIFTSETQKSGVHLRGAIPADEFTTEGFKSLFHREPHPNENLAGLISAGRSINRVMQGKDSCASQQLLPMIAHAGIILCENSTARFCDADDAVKTIASQFFDYEVGNDPWALKQSPEMRAYLSIRMHADADKQMQLYRDTLSNRPLEPYDDLMATFRLNNAVDARLNALLVEGGAERCLNFISHEIDPKERYLFSISLAGIVADAISYQDRRSTVEEAKAVYFGLHEPDSKARILAAAYTCRFDEEFMTWAATQAALLAPDTYMQWGNPVRHGTVAEFLAEMRSYLLRRAVRVDL